MDAATSKHTIYIVTEPVMLLSEKIKELCLQNIQRDEYYAWGLHQIAKAVYANVCVASVVVTSTLDWKLHAFDFLSEFDGGNEAASGPMLQYAWLVGSQYKPTELVKSDWSAVRKSPPWAIDSWGLENMSRRKQQRKMAGGGHAPPPKQEELQPHLVKDQLPNISYCIISPPPWPEAILLDFQHYLVMLGTSVLIPTYLVPHMGIGNKFEKTMRGTQGALIVASILQIVVGFSGLWRNVASLVKNCVMFLSPLSAVPLVALSWFGLYELGFPLVYVYMSFYE